MRGGEHVAGPNGACCGHGLARARSHEWLQHSLPSKTSETLAKAGVRLLALHNHLNTPDDQVKYLQQPPKR